AVTTPASGRGVAFGDLDNDGAIEIMVNNMNALPSLLKLSAKPSAHWIGIETIGVKVTRRGIGARVVCITGKHRQMDEVRSGGSYFSQNDLRLHFGLDQAKTADVEIRWPSGQTDTLKNLDANR